MGGNIGEPYEAYLKIQIINIIWVNCSFQLETINSISSKISIITNIANDHTDRYKNISDYVNQKYN